MKSESAGLPSCHQNWSHSTVTLDKLQAALADGSITAIEADILMGTVVMSEKQQRQQQQFDNNEDLTAAATTLVPIMSHPPEVESDLSAEKFLDLVTTAGNSSDDDDQQRPTNTKRKLQKHIKLDFKEIAAVEPTLRTLQRLADSLRVHHNDKTVYLNADILPGPGCVDDVADISVPCHEFIESCLGIIQTDHSSNNNNNNTTLNYAFSLGFKVDVVSVFGHSEEHLDEMSAVVEKFDLCNTCTGVVLAINARLLVKNMAPFQTFMEKHPSTQLLVWTGATEPPIAARTVNRIQDYFARHDLSHRVGFDCKLCAPIKAAVYDTVMFFMGVGKLFRAVVSSWFKNTSGPKTKLE